MVLGDSVRYFDEHGKSKPALVTAIHGEQTELNIPSVNLVFVSDDESREDSYGRQIERVTSVVHRSNQSAHGFFYEKIV